MRARAHHTEVRARNMWRVQGRRELEEGAGEKI